MKIKSVSRPPSGDVRIVSNLYVVKCKSVGDESTDNTIAGYVCIASTKAGALNLCDSPMLRGRIARSNPTLKAYFVVGTDTMPDQIVEVLY